ncbi:MAG: MAPEG family protein [Pseudomonadales bacterium]
MIATTIVAMFALLQYLLFGIAVGRARGRSGISAPAVTGNEEFERYFRAHQNTMEQLVILTPALFAAGYFVDDLFAAAFGLLFIAGRQLYFNRYVSEPTKRGPGMLLTAVSNLALILGAIIGAVVAYVS